MPADCRHEARRPYPAQTLRCPRVTVMLGTHFLHAHCLTPTLAVKCLAFHCRGVEAHPCISYAIAAGRPLWMTCAHPMPSSVRAWRPCATASPPRDRLGVSPTCSRGAVSVRTGGGRASRVRRLLSPPCSEVALPILGKSFCQVTPSYARMLCHRTRLRLGSGRAPNPATLLTHGSRAVKAEPGHDNQRASL